MSEIAPGGADKPEFRSLVGRLSAEAEAGNWEHAVSLARTLRAEFPLEPLAHLRGAQVLRQLRRYEEADAAILDAILLFPADPQPLLEACRIAQSRGDWRAAAHRAAILVERFPLQPAGYVVQAHAHRCLRAFVDAERVLGEGAARFPELAEFKVEACWLALAQENWELAVDRCAQLRRVLPSAQAGYQIAVVALRNLMRWPDAQAVLDHAEANCGWSDWILTESLRLAQQQNAPETIIELANRYLNRTPSNAAIYHLGSWAYRKLGRLDEAERLLERGMAGLEPQVQVLTEYAFVAQDRGDWAAADQRWSQANRLFPTDATVALWQARLPVYPGKLLNGADLLEAHRRYSDVHARFPSLGAAYADHIRMFRTANRPQDAEDVAKVACSKLPGDVQIRLEYSQVAADQGRREEALARLVEVRDRFEDDEAFQSRLVAALAAAGKEAEAEALCRRLLARPGGTAQPHIEFAELAMRRLDWHTAAERWEAASRRFPGQPWIRRRLFEAQLAATETDRREADAPSAPLVRAGPDELPMNELLARFESLAGTFQGCEFGRIQRHFGCEPLGLFRWAQIDIEDLIRATESGFHGMGTAEQTELALFDRDNGGFSENIGFNEHIAEYQVGDTRYRMRMHTFVRRDEMPHDKMMGQCLRRLQFLKRKLLEDLAEASKLFVYKRGHALLRVEDAERLSQALRRYSENNVLLCVYLATPEHPAGTSERITPNLVFGYVSHFSLGLDLNLRVPAFDEWAKVCRAAHGLCRSR